MRGDKWDNSWPESEKNATSAQNIAVGNSETETMKVTGDNGAHRENVLKGGRKAGDLEWTTTMTSGKWRIISGQPSQRFRSVPK
jgi:hypothetical protein